MFMGSAANAQGVVELGYGFNRMQDNWFVQATGGAGIMMSTNDQKADFMDRIGWKGNLYIGKWFSPLLGVRVGGEFNQMKGVAAQYSALGYRADKMISNDWPLQQFNNVGVAGDVLFNATNWILGYKPGRFYNATVYAGMGIHWVFDKENNGAGDWKYAGNEGGDHSRNFSFRAGLLNSFRISNHVDVLLDLRFEMMQEHVDGWGKRTWTEYPSAQLGFAYKFGKTEWDVFTAPVCPTYKYTDAEGDELVRKLNAANNKISDLEAKLRDCQRKLAEKPEPTVVNNYTAAQTVVSNDAPLATIYYPIGKSFISPVYKDVCNAVSEVMKEETGNYVLTGWADNYTGNDKINTKLRKDRVAGVKDYLVNKGVEESRLDAQINDGDLATSAKTAPLGRAVTITRAK